MSFTRHQLGGVLVFCHTNSFLVIHYFKDSKLEHYNFNINAPNTLTLFKNESLHEIRKMNASTTVGLHPVG